MKRWICVIAVVAVSISCAIAGNVKEELDQAYKDYSANKNFDAFNKNLIASFRSDRAGTLEWLIPLKDSIGEFALFTILDEWVKAEPEKAAEWALQLPDGKGKKAACISIVRAWMQKEPKKAIDWVMKLPKGNVKDIMIFTIVFTQMRQEPEKMTKWAMENVTDEKIKNICILLVAKEWGRKDSAAAAKWAKSLPEGELKKHALEGIQDAKKAKNIQDIQLTN